MWLSLFLHWLHRHWCVLALFQVEEKGEAFDRPYGRTDGRTRGDHYRPERAYRPVAQRAPFPTRPRAAQANEILTIANRRVPEAGLN